MSSQIRGLSQFIADIRSTNSAEAERTRVQAELSSIRRKISSNKLPNNHSGKGKTGYEYRKAVSKLLFVYLLGYEIDLGQDEVNSLVQMPKFAEKQVGYLALDLLLNIHHGLDDGIKSTVEADLRSPKESLTCLALNYMSNYLASDVNDNLVDLVFQLMISPTSSTAVSKKAALTFLNIYRQDPARFSTDVEWPHRVERIAAILGGNDLGVSLAICPLLIEIGTREPHTLDTNVTQLVIHKLSDVFTKKTDDSPSYNYHRANAPWLVASLCHLLRLCCFDDHKELLEEARQVLTQILRYTLIDSKSAQTEVEKAELAQSKNSYSLILVDALKLAIKLNIETWDPRLHLAAFQTMKSQLTSKDANTRYMALEAMQLFRTPLPEDPSETNHLGVIKVVLGLVKDRDISVRRQALDALYKLVDNRSVETVAAELLDLLSMSDLQIRPQMVSRLAALIERFASSHEWYFDTCISLLVIGGTYAGEEVWQRLAQVVVNNRALQQYAVKRMYETLQGTSSGPTSEPIVKLGAFILGEFSSEFCGEAIDLFLVLQDQISSVTWQNRGVLLTSYVKFAARSPETRTVVRDALEVYVDAPSLECQQRATEYLSLLKPENEDLLLLLTKPMPPFGADTTSQLFQQMGHKRQEELLKEPPQVQSLSEAGTGDSLKKQQNHLSSNWEFGFKRMLTHSEAVLYQDAMLQIGCRYYFAQSQGRINIYIKNISSYEISSVNLSIHNPMSEDSFVIKSLGQSQKLLSAGSAAEVTITCEAKLAFALSPICRITYLAGTLGEVQFKLPIILERFMTPSSITAEQFYQRWEQLGSGFEFSKQFQNFSVSKACKTEEDDHQILQGMQYGVANSSIDNLSLGANALMGAGIIHTSVGGKFGCLVALLPDAQSSSYRVTIRSTCSRLTSVILANNISLAYQL